MRLFLLLFISLSASMHSFGQSKSTAAPFPTYQQLKPANREIVDYVSTSGESQQTQQMRINLFDYPPKTVTYILNGKATTDTKSIKKLLSRQENHIESVSISVPTEEGKRIIKIDYSTY